MKTEHIRKRKIDRYIVLIIIASLILSTVTLTAKSLETGKLISDKSINIQESKQWTWMFYDDADFDNAFDPLDDHYSDYPTFTEAAYSTDNLNVIVLQDRNDGSCKIMGKSMKTIIKYYLKSLVRLIWEILSR